LRGPRFSCKHDLVAELRVARHVGSLLRRVVAPLPPKRELLGRVRFRDAWHLGFFGGFGHFGWLWLGAGAPREKPSVSYGAEKKTCTPLGVQNSSVFVLAIRGPWFRGEDRWVSWGCSAPLRGGGGPEGASPGPERSHEVGSRGPRTPGPFLGGWVRVLWLGAPEQPSLWGAGALGRWEFRKGVGPPLERDLSFLEAENGCFVYRVFSQPHTKMELLGWVRFRDAWHLGFFAGFRDV